MIQARGEHLQRYDEMGQYQGEETNSEEANYVVVSSESKEQAV